MRLIITILTLVVSPHLFALTSMPSLPPTESANLQDDRVVAFNELKAKALGGDLDSLYQLALKYENGSKGVCSPNKKVAFEIQKYLANAGYNQSQRYLYKYYYEKSLENNHSTDLLAECYKWVVISGASFMPPKISDAAKAEGTKRANEFIAARNKVPSESEEKLQK
jgi:hypothetical protein